ncbi:SGNH/GDSL hydrolase family protein [Alicyclobacillus cycloheptanicus]|uniref:Lysophospholipase L1-like esterase n=1 Tax=Alicyclobacillus cycloheptanicus TaxID=1457 RepID=A0ABT9XJ86_9BACL|nr:SGNH/GDSL hydrolase family protein [Alicyclobacillus cycloheptanicus]MDQ0189781.1 lysophospholipase L1-like esterase [Alicyclobacillus cycloheptanicus]WDM01984.1 SGNH/GDSL hydrolase family protein [Alicyclobacillus cycloheptanicus]
MNETSGLHPGLRKHTARGRAIVCLMGIFALVCAFLVRGRVEGDLIPVLSMLPTSRVETVDVFGGSMTDGWLDPTRDSFVHRAFQWRSITTPTRYRYMNYAIPGYTALRFSQRYPGRFQRILFHQHPQVVVIAWGLENDMNSRHRDTVRVFGRAVKQEIAQSLRAHAVVLLVTPPVTKELDTVDHRRVYTYIHELFRVGASFHNPNVIDMNVYQQMQSYMKAHHQTYKQYYGNAWHPNRAGHILAGRILARDLQQHFGNGPIQWKPRHSSNQGPTTNL